MKTLKSSLLILVLLISSIQARAEKMNSETQTAVIERLERIISMMEKNDASYATSSLRLADLLAERARLRFMNEIEASCQGCKGSVADRKRAIELYEGISNKPKVDQGAVYFQLAHLYNMQGDTKKAAELFNRVITSKKPAFGEELVARAHEGVADIYFHEGKSKLAQEHYEKSLASKTTTNRGLLTYRVAWCEFNQDHLKLATKTLENVLAKPELLTKDTPDGPQYDAALHEDVTRDLATFYARGTVTQAQIARYTQLAPQGLRKDLLLFFANEVSRVGQKKAAGQVYQAYLQERLTKEERLDALVSNTQVQYDMGSSYQSTEDFALAAKAFKDTGCATEEKCADLQKRMRRYVTELHRSKKAHVTKDVLKAYAIYIQTFPDDSEMAGLGAQVAMDLKFYGDAMALYHEAAVSSHRKMKGADFAKLDEKEQKKITTLKATGLAGEIEAAELSKDSKAREKAYINYLALMPDGDKQFAIRYQLAQLAYEGKNWPQAAQEFETLALDKTGGQDLRKKSADLALDSLALMKADGEIEKWAATFAQALPAYRDEFMKLSRKAVINQVAQTANSEGSSNSDLKSALGKLRAMNMAGASDVEKILHYKNESVLAQKTGDNEALMASLTGLLAVKSLSAADREETLSRKVGYYETRLEFKQAYQTANQMKFSGKSAGDRELRLGTLAELAGISPAKHYEAFLKASPRSAQANFIRSRLVMLSSNKLSTLKKYKTELARDPQLLSQIVLSIYGQNQDMKAVQPYLQMKGVAHMAAARLILKQPFYKEHATFAHKISQHKLNVKNQGALKKGINERVKLLAQADQNLKQAMRMNDYTAQVITLTTVSRENFRLVSDIMSLPVPKNLNIALQKQYMGLLKQQAMPYMTKAQAADGKLQEFWANTKARETLVSDFQNAQKEVKPVFQFEIRILASVAPDNIRSELISALKTNGPGNRDLISARQAAVGNPQDVRLLQNLKALETKLGNPVMANYLDNRLNRNQSSEVL